MTDSYNQIKQDGSTNYNDSVSVDDTMFDSMSLNPSLAKRDESVALSPTKEGGFEPTEEERQYPKLEGESFTQQFRRLSKNCPPSR